MFKTPPKFKRGIELYQTAGPPSNRLLPRTPLFSTPRDRPDSRYFVGRVKQGVLENDAGMVRVVGSMISAFKAVPQKTSGPALPAVTRKQPHLKMLVLDLD